ncbi:WDR44 family WD repeat protein [Schizosaccharomyces cryophilus OY26]|uniref:WDR44 family WD repeat protein n=1 Tax=Schizosaccharomyces cryophilus (strain OY26 / ATCC MYA-4695 / CBS 11777 / NBRC 106824 / NRRL Y48691) TaxID=653667 RepID=S9VZ89_SCHCR|nr:WDR44 family WD repeat protein [Schizosaccharomyces cryophilus OY26]EPY52938.1 WDR44 family WD repeat protein [Schizosaccharomyces cryophilus OY26]
MELLLQDGHIKENMLEDPQRSKTPSSHEGIPKRRSPVNAKRLPKRPTRPNLLTVAPRNTEEKNTDYSIDNDSDDDSPNTSSSLNGQSENESDEADDISLANTSVNSSSTAAEVADEEESPTKLDERKIQSLYPKHKNHPVSSREHLRYVPVHKRRMPKKEMTLSQKIFVAQVINTGSTEIPNHRKRLGKRFNKYDPSNYKSSLWASEVSASGKYLATAGKDSNIRVWKVIESKKDRSSFFKEETKRKESYFSGFSIFEPEPVLSCTGHRAEVLCVSWSKNDFLLTASSDRTVRLWHPRLNRCLAIFQHNEIVTCVSFHPTDDRFFVSGTLDHRIQLWSVLEHKTLQWNQLEYSISAICFQPNGQRIIVGMFYGMCALFETEQLRYVSSWLIHRSSSRNRKSRITGLQCTNATPGELDSEAYVLVSTNDSSIRLFDVKNRSLILKVDQDHRINRQVLSRLNEDNNYIISRSDSNEVTLWHLPYKFLSSTSKRRGVVRHLPMETFRICTERLTSAIIAPSRTAVEVARSEGYSFPGKNWKSAFSKVSEKTADLRPIDIIIVSNMAGKIIVLRRDCLQERKKSSLKGSVKFRKFVHDWLHI